MGSIFFVHFIFSVISVFDGYYFCAVFEMCVVMFVFAFIFSVVDGTLTLAAMVCALFCLRLFGPDCICCVFSVSSNPFISWVCVCVFSALLACFLF